jgi:Uncharacterized conserved protein
MKHRRFVSSFLVFIGAAIFLLLMVPFLREGFFRLFHPGTMVEIRSMIHSLGLWGPIVSILLMILHSLTFIPSEVITLANLAVFGPFWGAVYSWIGSMLGAYLAFFTAKAFGRPVVQKFVPEQMIRRFDRFMNRYGTKGVFALRLIPVISFNALNYGCGLTKMTFWPFTWTTGLGITPSIVVFAFLYNSAAGMNNALAGLGIVGIIILVVLIVKFQAVKHFNKSRR